MVRHSIKVYARLKPEDKNVVDVERYEIKEGKSYEDLIVYDQDQAKAFRFHKIFDENSKQHDVFETVAEPVIDSVLEGFNGTIFAYGQTGSGKTYSITGSSKNYNERGIIPRSIQHIFAKLEQIPAEDYTIHISYMEIYNDTGYDLLNAKSNSTPSRLEELPRVAMLDNGKIKNLSVLSVQTEEQAMRLLFFGDTNRTIAETPLNEYSSRSHCIFTIYIAVQDEKYDRIRFSKLHIVDLAGSERVHKSQVTGSALCEAKYINLSLHHLESVIHAITEKRPHIPYRNSMITYILKDSLCGNCLTVMLATFTLNKTHLKETVSTCNFAQRVSLVKVEAIINEVLDPHKEIIKLKTKITELENQIAKLKSLNSAKELSPNDKQKCERLIQDYLNSDSDTLEVGRNTKMIQYCFSIFRKVINEQKGQNDIQDSEIAKIERELYFYKDLVNKKLKEIDILKSKMDDIHRNASTTNYLKTKADKECYFKEKPNLDDKKFDLISDADLYKEFLSNPQYSAEIDHFYTILNHKYELAKTYAETIEQCQKNINLIRKKYENVQSDEDKNQLQNELIKQQNVYRKSIADLKELKDETTHLQFGLERAESKLNQNFQEWIRQRTRGPTSRVLRSEKALNTENGLRSAFIPERIRYIDSNRDQNMFLSHQNSVQELPVNNAPNYHGDKTMDLQKDKDLSGILVNDRISLSKYKSEFFYPQPNTKSDHTLCNYCDYNNARARLELNCPKIEEDPVGEECACMNSDSSLSLVPQKIDKIQDLSNEHSDLLQIDPTNKFNQIGYQSNVSKDCNPCKPIVKDTDSPEFIEFIKSVPLTGQDDVDAEIINFYRNKFAS